MKSSVLPLIIVYPAVVLSAPVRAADAMPDASDTQGLQEIVVTATKQSESISKVPLSIAAFTQADLDHEGSKNVADIANLTPGVTISKAISFGSGAGDNISIRGISSTAGAPTTAIYVDDTPIQVRMLNFSSNAYPELFDLARVEVLRGPQGTLFGASSEGGTIRFITPTPDLGTYTAYARTEMAYTQNGAPSEEVGAAVGGPIVSDELGFRASVWTRQDGGWVDRQNYETKLAADDVNSQGTMVSRIAFTWKPLDNFTLTPALFYQKLDSRDSGTYWPSLSSPSSENFVSGNVVAQPRHDLMELPSLKTEYQFSGAILTSISSFFRRYETTTEDFTDFESAAWGPSPYPYLPGQNAYMNTLTQQNNFNQEIRLQSPNPNARFTWDVGVYYSEQRLHSTEYVTDLFFPTLVFDATGETLDQFFGQGLADGRYTVTSEMRSKDTETALFGQGGFGITDQLKLVAGVRVSKSSFSFHDIEGGPVNGATPILSDGGKTEHPVTPKVGLTDQYDPNNLYYLTVAKGYRGGGAQLAVPVQACGPDLANLGITSIPKTYDADNLWSYELGAKNKLYDNRIALSSSIFYVDWRNIQQLVPLVSCGYNFFTNLGRAASKGFDSQIQVQINEHVVTDLSLGYTDAKFKETLSEGGTANLVRSGDSLDGFSPWTVVADGEYRAQVLGYPSYTRATVEFHSAQSDKIVRLDPTAVNYDPSYPAVGSNTQVNLRTGVTLANWDISLFADNLLDAHPVLATTHDIKSSTLFYQSTFRPRTVGLTAVFRY